jgi:hypothetical protein
MLPNDSPAAILCINSICTSKTSLKKRKMKKNIIITCSSLLMFFCTYAQSTAETEIRKLENDQKEAFLKKDTLALYKLLSLDFVVNAPTNKITTLQATIISVE